MKFFVFSIVLLITFHGSSAQLASQGSLRIQKEFNSYSNTLEEQAINAANNLKTLIQSRLNQFYVQYVNARTRIGTALNSLGPDGKAIADKINKDLDDLVANLKNGSSDASLQPKVNGVLAGLQSKYLDPIEKDIVTLRNAVNSNPRAIKCWDLNKGTLATQFNKVLQRAQIVISTNLALLDNRIVSVANHVFIIVQSREYDVESRCETDAACIKDYV